MGWSGGTEIFDTVAKELIELSHKWTGRDFHEDFMEPLKALLFVLEDKDWGNACESEYWDNPVIGAILGNEFDIWEDE